MPTSTLDFLVGRGTVVGYNATTPLPASPVYTPLAQVISMDGINITMDDIEGGLLSSTFMPARPGTPKGERATMTCQFMPGDPGLTTLSGWIATGSPPTVNWKVNWEDGSSTTFRGYIGGLSLKGIENNGRLTYDVPLRVTSYPVTTAAA